MVIAADPVPMKADADGVIRIGGTRVTLDSVVASFDRGASPEVIVDQFPTLQLADVYRVVAYVLGNREQVDAYLAEQDRAIEVNMAKWEKVYPTDHLLRRLAQLRERGAK